MRTYQMTDEEKKFLNTYDITAFDRPSLTADMAVFAILTENETEEYRKDPAQKLGILLVRREGFPYKGSWALPGGFAKNGESIDETALRELREETGYESDSWSHLLTVPSQATLSDNLAWIFRAENCRPAAAQRLDDMELLDVQKHSPAEIEEMIFSGRFQQAVHITAWLLTARKA